MRRIGIIAAVAWAIALVSIVAQAAWARCAASSSAANHRPVEPAVHSLMLVGEGFDASLAVAAFASVVAMRSTRRVAPAILAVIGTVAILKWGPSLGASIRHTDRIFFALRPWTSTHSILFWHAFVEPGARCLLAAVGLVCGVIGITVNRKKSDAESGRAGK